MEVSEMKEKTLEELQVLLKDFKMELFKLRFQLASNQLSNTARIKAVKKQIAKVKTVMVENEKKNAESLV